MQKSSICFLILLVLFITISVSMAEDEPKHAIKRDALKLWVRSKRCCYGCFGCGYPGFGGFGGLGFGLGIGAGIGLFG
ncbi:hypothetical protein ACQ4LE_003623 [Meloidogyne hapla]